MQRRHSTSSLPDFYERRNATRNTIESRVTQLQCLGKWRECQGWALPSTATRHLCYDFSFLSKKYSILPCWLNWRRIERGSSSCPAASRTTGRPLTAKRKWRWFKGTTHLDSRLFHTQEDYANWVRVRESCQRPWRPYELQHHPLHPLGPVNIVKTRKKKKKEQMLEF